MIMESNMKKIIESSNYQKSVVEYLVADKMCCEYKLIYKGAFK